MPVTDLKLPSGGIVTLIYGAKYPAVETLYHQGIRSERVTEDSDIAVQYRSMEKTYAARLANYVAAAVDQADAVLLVPSRRDDAEGYHRAIRQHFGTKDLTPGFSRKNRTKAAEVETVEEMVSEFEYRSDGQENEIKSLIIIDESLATGKSVAALLEHLHIAGLPESSRIVVVVWSLLRE